MAGSLIRKTISQSVLLDDDERDDNYDESESDTVTMIIMMMIGEGQKLSYWSNIITTATVPTDCCLEFFIVQLLQCNASTPLWNKRAGVKDCPGLCSQHNERQTAQNKNAVHFQLVDQQNWIKLNDVGISLAFDQNLKSVINRRCRGHVPSKYQPPKTKLA